MWLNMTVNHSLTTCERMSILSVNETPSEIAVHCCAHHQILKSVHQNTDISLPVQSFICTACFLQPFLHASWLESQHTNGSARFEREKNGCAECNTWHKFTQTLTWYYCSFNSIWQQADNICDDYFIQPDPQLKCCILTIADVNLKICHRRKVVFMPSDRRGDERATRCFGSNSKNESWISMKGCFFFILGERWWIASKVIKRSQEVACPLYVGVKKMDPALQGRRRRWSSRHQMCMLATPTCQLKKKRRRSRKLDEQGWKTGVQRREGQISDSEKEEA